MKFEKVTLKVNGKDKYATLTNEKNEVVKVFHDGDIITDARKLVEVHVQIKHSQLRFHAVKGYEWTKVHNDGTFKYCYKDFNPQKGVLVPYFPPQNKLEAWLEKNQFGYSLKHVRYINSKTCHIEINYIDNVNDFLIVNRDANVIINMDRSYHLAFIDINDTFGFTLRRNAKGDIAVDSVIVTRMTDYDHLINSMEAALKYYNNYSDFDFDGDTLNIINITDEE